MTAAMRKRVSRFGFRGRLLILVSIGIFGLAIMITMLSGWITKSRYEERTIKHGIKIVQDLADKSVLPLLFANDVDAEKVTKGFIGFNEVMIASLFYPSGELFIKSESKASARSKEAVGIKTAQLLHNDQHELHFAAPVFVSEKSWSDTEPISIYDHNKSKSSELAGYAYIVIDKLPTQRWLLGMLTNNILLAIGVSSGLLLLVNLGINRMTRPLQDLCNAMENASPNVEVVGPKEVTHIASVYNRMMDGLIEQDRELVEHRNMLEAQVAIRTQELKEARDLALEASRAKSEFLANTSHELRTPLQSIMGWADLVRDELSVEGRDEQAGYLETVSTDAQKLLDLINTILDLAKIEAGHMELKVKEVNVMSMIHEVANTVKPMMEHNDNTLEVGGSVDQECVVKIDRTRVGQVLTNLLSNAAKFTHGGTINLTAAIVGHSLHFTVSDTGIGIPKEQLATIFDAFKQVDGSESKTFEGTGLGLAITKQFIQLMKGNVEVVSEVGKGSVFKVQIPFASE